METVEQYLARGGKIEQLPVDAGDWKDPALKFCRCGCRGDWTEHTMRASESGRIGCEVVR